MNQAFVALGSNLQDPVKQVQNALHAVGNIPRTCLVKQSSLYQTAPIDCVYDPQQPVPDFINAVVLLETDLTPLALLEALFDIEKTAGRERPYINAPRVLDCDLLLYNDITMHTSKLTLPHPRMHSRGFILLPLFEIAPHLSLPNHGKIAQLMESHQFTGIKKL
ncbi:MAG: 2-amino-4-hydroxy-6-hydroxymethyldihydropteridine diphosphokinase [Methylotenera sp.]|nr:2-amino-4-hydroxy-6-hydroxymethyldihydropteridine diphosphokinase [Methylotenera sp.]MSP99679.1 2-amino-4-hydroxy-6-hydroxymethyldihydropteridine diphosphokinase [Methylotenera sp.]